MTNEPLKSLRFSNCVTLKGLSRESLQARAALPEQPLIPGLTVAVCTYKRAESVVRFLNSLWLQTRHPDELIIVDASPDTETEEAILQRWHDRFADTRKVYCRVAGNLRGLTRQRNLALTLCSREIVAFFDDDIVLDPDCLQSMEVPFLSNTSAVGIGCYLRDEDRNPGYRWQLLRLLGAIPDLMPGRYTRSGLSIPLRLLQPTQDLLPVDRLQGCSMAWRSALARRLGFNEQFGGYCQAEDLEFSCRAAKHGKLFISTKATARHLHEAGGRPDQYRRGRMEVLNRYMIHRAVLPNRNWKDVVWFAYAQSLVNFLHASSFFVRGRVRDGLNYTTGLLEGTADVAKLWMRSTHKQSSSKPLTSDVEILRR